MKQRLEIVRALSVKPQLLLMDEPFKSLDVALKYHLQELILAEQAKEKFAVLFITHDPREAVMLADRVIVLSDKPARIHEELVIDIPREVRHITDGKIYGKAEKILDFLLKRST
jgi:NitT/TauT family transport system ATP-binding protein